MRHIENRSQLKVVEEINEYAVCNRTLTGTILMNTTTMKNVFDTDRLVAFIGFDVYKTNDLPDDIIFVGKKIECANTERRNGDDRRKPCEQL